MNRHAIPDVDLRQKLEARGLECHLLTGKQAKPATEPVEPFAKLLYEEISDVEQKAYCRHLTPAHLQDETWAVTLRQTGAPHAIIACSTLSFRSDIPSYFQTRFEAVRPGYEGKGVGRLLFECITAWTRLLITSDHLVIEGITRSSGSYCIASFIDRDDEYDEDNNYGSPDDNSWGHGVFLKKLGFVRAVHDFQQEPDTEIAYQLEFHVPLNDWFEEKQGLPARPDSA